MQAPVHLITNLAYRRRCPRSVIKRFVIRIGAKHLFTDPAYDRRCEAFIDKLSADAKGLFTDPVPV